jgi:hypothetical protein
MNKKPKRHCDFCNKEINNRPRAWIRHETCFCDKACEGNYRKNRIINKCTICETEIETTPTSNKKTCSKKCFKEHLKRKYIERPIVKRSYLEVFIAHMIDKNFPELKYIPNDRELLDGFEIDLYFPELKIGVECSGPYHYQNIYGEDELKKIQSRDKMKRGLAKKKGIDIKTIKAIKSISRSAKTEALNYFKECCEYLNMMPTCLDVNMKEVLKEYQKIKSQNNSSPSDSIIFDIPN